MMKLKGPALSAAAHGSIADVLTFANNNRRNSCRTWSKPRNTRTQKQLYIRYMIAFLGPEWAKLTGPQKLSWLGLADDRKIAPYHAFLAANMTRWNNYLAPSVTYPATEAGPTPFVTRPNAYPGHLSCRFRSFLGAAPNCWGWIFHLKKSPVPFTPDVSTVRNIKFHFFPPRQEWYETDLTPGVYYCYLQTFSPTGLKSAFSTARVFIIT